MCDDLTVLNVITFPASTKGYKIQTKRRCQDHKEYNLTVPVTVNNLPEGWMYTEVYMDVLLRENIP
jgi:hypothetical protein